MSLLELKDVTVSFPFPHGRPPLLALDGLTLSVEQGELVALVGPSGCGKTTALNVLAGQVRPTSGQVRLAGEPVEGMLPSVGYISQADTLLPGHGASGHPQGPAAGNRPGPHGQDGPGRL